MPASDRSRPLAVAHRAGNDLTALRAAEAVGVDLVEADLWRFHGRVEVRHLKTVGPLPIYWDRWYLARPFARHLRLEELLEAVGPDTELLLDLKGDDLRLSEDVRALAAELRPGRPYSVCSQSWPLLAPFDNEGVRVFYSAGNASMVEGLLRLAPQRPPDGFSVHAELLGGGRGRRLRERAPLLLTWPVNTAAQLDAALRNGANGMISDSLELLRGLLDQDPSPAA